MDEFESGLEQTRSLVSRADINLTVKHPRLGNFNAPEWFRFNEVHLKHHLYQLDRLTPALQAGE
ncbi:MAG: hypothetical protein EOP51_29685 [Sphingobacteriales bacterium]|nr:MAG: hypothetical protein EOP51_29685 [Sphingobacteriales bacterium]